MILINLLPHREEKRKRRKAAFFVGMGISFVVGVVLVGLGYTLLQQLTASQVHRNEFLKAEIGKLDEQIKDIANLRQEIDSLKARQRAVEDLQSDRNTPVYLLNELARHTPEGVYLNGIKQVGKTVTITGVAATNERVSELLRNVGHADWLEKPDLVEIKLANLATNARDQRRLFDFSMRVSIKSPEGDAAAAAASSASAAGQPKKP